MTKGTKAERRAYVEHRAEELAETGNFANYRSIETHLRFAEGYPEARSVLDNRFKRWWLNNLCKQARGEPVEENFV